jgi:gliding motility-associated-like protein
MGTQFFKRKGKGVFPILISFLFLSFHVSGQKDLPHPSSNLQSLLAGSFVVPMDTLYQSIVPVGQAHFNLKAYGLVNKFLQNGIPVKWVIRSGKNRDDIDFSGLVEQVAPVAASASTVDFRGGPFIVPDTVLPCGLTTRQIIALYGNNVAVYRLTANTTADIRYKLVHRPKIAVFNNGGNQLIHTKILDAAGIGNYDVMDAADIANLINCYTYVSEPHADTSQISLTVINAVRNFVLNGGNFLAQCHAVNSYENRGLFQTTAGITIVNTPVSHLYPNADLAFSQMHGPLQQNEGGSIQNWTTKPGSNWLPFMYPAVSHTAMDTVVATGAHLIATSAQGGNVFYLGGHDYSKGKGGTDLSSLARVNGLRLYLNGIFIPSNNSNGAWANAGPDQTKGCSDSVTLGCTLTGPPGSTFLWTPSAGLSCVNCANPVAKPTVTTNYVVEVTNGCVARDTVRVVVVPKFNALFANTAACKGTPTNFMDQSIGSSYRHWDFGDPSSGTNNFSSLQNPTHVFSSAGSYFVQLISGILPICVDTTVQPVEVYPLPVGNFSPNGKGCAPVKVSFTDLSSVASGSIVAWAWSFGDPSNADNTSALQNPDHTYINTGNYEVTVAVTTDHGCTASYTKQNSVTVSPDPSVDLGPDQKICTEQSHQMVTLDAGVATSYRWMPTGDSTRTISVSQPGTYSVTVTNPWGCSKTASCTVIDVCPPKLFVSNSFTPNGDGKNDHYAIYGEHFSNFHMFIFNRWGEIIFESQDRANAWDGVYKGAPMPIGVYPWIITYTGDSEEYHGPYRMEGSVTVVR